MQTNITMPPPAATCHRETAENYDRAMLLLNDRWRIIECKDALQWVIQQREGAVLNPLRAAWRNRYYHRHRHTLIEAVRRLNPGIPAVQMAVLNRLPAICGQEVL